MLTLDKRAAIDKETRIQKHAKIYKALMPYLKNVDTIALYASFRDEVDTWKLLHDEILFPHIVVPRVEGDTMSFYRYQGEEHLIPSNYGILEPDASCELVSPEEIDVIVVPLVAFDEKKHRIGYGGGFYDKFLPLTNALTIAIAYEEQKVENIIALPHDIALDLIITDQHIYK